MLSTPSNTLFWGCCTFASIFPNLQLLDLNSCTDISEKGIGHVLRRCCKIRHLNLSELKPPRVNFVLTLEVLDLSKSGIDDSSLYMISKCCFGLLHLDLSNCSNVTEQGVMQVVENCTQLREITPPPNYRCSESRMKHFLCHGCFVQTLGE
ncbi:unnamed protein product [Trifolium pratense]|uniref:Uncharacterized protein n=1 Tax=Trifolium pratense TaxID=57577 RepID=A0ACB0LM88_TRIPR|nr:unnamed protein product [Trifolium pratense]